MLISQPLKKLSDKNQHTFLWSSLVPCRIEWSQKDQCGTSPKDSCLPTALVSALYARLLPYHLQEMLMEHICIVKWAHHRIVWPSQSLVRRAVMFFDITTLMTLLIETAVLYVFVSVYYSMLIVLLHFSWACTVCQSTLHRFWVKKVKEMEEPLMLQ